MIQSRPKLKSKKTVNISLLLVIIAFIVFPLSSLTGKFTPLVQLGCIILVSISINMLLKYVVNDYLYTLDNDRITIHKITKSKSVCVADISLSDIDNQLFVESEFKAKYPDFIKKYTYIKNPGSDNVRYLVCHIDDMKYAVIIEPDEAMQNAVNSRLQQSKEESNSGNEQ